LPKFPPEVLRKRLDNEEQELAAKGYEFSKEDVWKETEVVGERPEKIPVARKYSLSIKARGFWKPKSNAPPKPIWDHKVLLYVLDTYPFISKSTGVPLRAIWLTPLFHPNIANGVEAKGTGFVCWPVLKDKWTHLDTLYGIVRGLQILVENPNLGDTEEDRPLRFDECQAAYKWFRENPRVLSSPKILEEEPSRSSGAGKREEPKG
jgi:hypothetical protein